MSRETWATREELSARKSRIVTACRPTRLAQCNAQNRALKFVSVSVGPMISRSLAMPLWMQHFLVLAAVIGCVLFIGWQAFQSLRGRKSKLNGCGSCKTCGPAETKPTGPRTAIIPVDLLRKR